MPPVLALLNLLAGPLDRRSTAEQERAALRADQILLRCDCSNAQSKAAVLSQIRIAPAFPPSTVVMLTHRGIAPEMPAVGQVREAFLRVAPAM